MRILACRYDGGDTEALEYAKEKEKKEKKIELTRKMGTVNWPVISWFQAILARIRIFTLKMVNRTLTTIVQIKT